ncbi:MAG: hypothetical protein J0M08_05400 [Bacteroidetes bacterium]|nr:hypothetical protein [Bacteroidota bacterium]
MKRLGKSTINYYFLFSFLLGGHPLFSQFVFSPNHLSTSPNQGLEFNQFERAVVQKNKVRAIKINYAVKPDNQPIKDYNFYDQFFFNEEGQLIQSMRVEERKIVGKDDEQGNGRKHIVSDSSITYYHYNKEGNLQIKRTRLETGFTSWYYEYNDGGFVSKLTNVREQNVGNHITNFIPSAQVVISLETFAYERLPNYQFKVKCFNDESRIYKEIIKYFSDDNLLLRETHDFSIGWVHLENIYSYNTKKQLTEKVYSSNASGDMNEKYTIGYTENGQLSIISKYKSNELVFQDNFIFYDNGLLKSRLSRDEKNKKIDIYKISYY